MSGVFGGVDPASIAAQLIAPQIPPTESTAGSAGSALKAPAADHSHPRLSSSSYSSATAADGTVTVMFTRKFTTKPAFIYSVDNLDGVTCTVVQWLFDTDGTTYIGAKIRASKRTAVSALTTAVITLITVVTGATTTNNDTPVAGAVISAVFLAQS